jgi:CheY-like chemotaxis protein
MKSILVVEDDVFIRDLVSAHLIKENFNVQTANSGEKALMSIKEHVPDLMILDLDIVGVQGLGVLSTVRSDEQWKDLPVIVFSNNDNPQAKEKCIELGVTRFYLKFDTDLNDLVDCINEKLT